MTTDIIPHHNSTRSLPLYAGSYHALQRRMHTLGMTDAQVDACRTIGDLQRLAKPQYRKLAKRYHPDHITAKHWGGHLLNGYTFRLIERAYHWLIALPDGLLVPWNGRPPFPREAWDPDGEDLGWGWHITYY
jgi:hypothetical protein